MEYPIGTIITGKRVNYRMPRVAALTLLSFAIALGFARVGTTVITTTHAPTAAQCGTTGVKGGHPSSAGGTIKIGG